jgi:hypothetical protein
MITPTIGRMVWYWPHGREVPEGTQPFSAQIAYVHSVDVINIGYLDANGESHNAMGVRLLQEGEAPFARTAYCEWMPYQKGQAAKTEALERQILGTENA